MFYGDLLKYVEGAHIPNTDNVGLYDRTEKLKWKNNERSGYSISISRGVRG